MLFRRLCYATMAIGLLLVSGAEALAADDTNSSRTSKCNASVSAETFEARLKRPQQLFVSTVAVGQVAPCAQCSDKCSNYMEDCKKGGQASCYRAAACLCQCNLDAGGCGSSTDALQQCVDDNNKKAKDLE
jgi:hypothetical protein